MMINIMIIVLLLLLSLLLLLLFLSLLCACNEVFVQSVCSAQLTDPETKHSLLLQVSFLFSSRVAIPFENTPPLTSVFHVRFLPSCIPPVSFLWHISNDTPASHCKPWAQTPWISWLRVGERVQRAPSQGRNISRHPFAHPPELKAILNVKDCILFDFLCAVYYS